MKKSHSLKRRALATFLISSVLFLLLIGFASRLYISTITNSYTAERNTNNAFIGFEFSKIIKFYAETDPEKLITSDLLQLYSHLEDETYMAVLHNDTVIFGDSFYTKTFENGSESLRSSIQIMSYSINEDTNDVITIFQSPPP